MTNHTAPPALLTLRTADGDSLIATSRQWPAKRRDILRRLQSLVQDGPAGIPPLNPQPLVQVERDRFVEQRVGYAVQVGEIRNATLLLPWPLEHRQPAVVCCAGEGNAPATIARKLAKRGYVVLIPDERPEATAAETLWEYQRALDFLCHLDAVDSDRLAAMGQGPGGLTAILLAAFDHRIKALAAACAYQPVAAAGRPGWLQAFEQQISEPFEWVEVLALVAPRAFHYTYAMQDETLPAGEAVREDMIELGRLYDLLGTRDKFSFHEHPGEHGYPVAAQREALAMFKRILQDRK